MIERDKESRTLHMGMTKGFVIQSIRRFGTDDLLPDWSGTPEEAVAAIEADPRAIFCSCECVKDETGACTCKLE